MIVQVSALSSRTSVLRIQEEPLTVCSNSAVAVVVGSGQEALGLFICQDTSAGGEPLEEIPAEDGHKSVQQADAALARNRSSMAANADRRFLNYGRKRVVNQTRYFRVCVVLLLCEK